MLKSIVINSVAVATIAVLSLALMVVLASMVPEANAEASQPESAAAPACSLQGWPYYESRCQFDRRADSVEPRIVRVIDRR